jgi:PAS domain S-box-containing protein
MERQLTNEELQSKLNSLERERSYLQLMAHMMQQINTVSGLNNFISKMLSVIAENFKSNQVSIYCCVEGYYFYTNALGEPECFSVLDDPDIETVFKTAEPLNRTPETEKTSVTEPGEAVRAWIFPLKTGNEVVAVLKMANVALSVSEATLFIDLVLNHAALILLNEIKNDKLRQANQQFKEKNERFRFIIEATNAGTWEWNVQTGEVIYSEDWSQMLGYTFDELSPISIGTWTKLCHPDDLVTSQKQLERCFQKETDRYETESRLRHKDGHWVWMLDQGKVMEWDADGKPLLMIGTHQNITERKKAEEAILVNEQRLESLLRISQYSTKSIQNLLDFALEEVIALTKSKIGYIYFYDEQKKEFTLNTWSKEVMQQCTIVSAPTTYELDKTGIWGEAVRQKRPIMVNNFEAHNLLKKGIPEGHVQLHKFLTIPVLSEDHIVAVVGVANKEDDYNEADVRQLTLMMDAVWKIVQRNQSEENIFKANRLYALISQVNQTIVHYHDRESLFSKICEIIIGLGKFRMAWIGIVDPVTKSVVPVSFAGHEEGYLSDIVPISTEDKDTGRGPTGTAVRENHYFVCNDIDNDPSIEIWREEALKRGYCSSIALPLCLYGEPIGALSIYSGQPYFFYDEEIKLLEEVGSDISYAISAIETEKKRKKAEHDARERFKEISAFYKLAELTEKDGLTLTDLYQNFVEVLPGSWQYVELAFARITVNNNDFTTKNYIENSPWVQRSPIYLQGEQAGFIEVGYTQQCPEEDEGPFLKEERLLIDGLAKRLGKTIEKVMAEEQLKNEEFFNQSIIDNLPGIFFLYTYPQFQIVRWNKNHETMLGLTSEELKGKLTSEWEYPGDKERIIEAMHQIARDGSGRTEAVIYRKDGIPISFLLTGAKLEMGGQIYILGFGINITARKLMEEKLIHSENLFKAIMLQSPSVIELYNLDGLQINVNRAYEELWGFPAYHSLNKFNILKSEEVRRTGLIDYVMRAYNGEAVQVPAYRFDPTGRTEGRGKGRVRWLSTRIYPLKDRDHNVLNIIITHEDVTLKRQAEQVVANSAQKFENLSKSGMDMLKLSSLDEIYAYLIATLHEQYPQTVLIFSTIDEKRECSRVLSIKGVSDKLIQKSITLTGYNFFEKEFTLLPHYKRVFRTGRFHLFETGLAEFLGFEFPKAAAHTIEKMLGVRQIFTIGINKDDNLFAAIHFFNCSPEPITDNEYIETFVKQAGIVIEKTILEQLLKESEERYRLIAENTSDVIWSLNINTLQLSYISPSVVKLTGFTVEEAMQQSVIDIVDEESSKLIMTELSKRIAEYNEGRRDRLVEVNEVKQRCKDGSLIWVEYVTMFLFDEDQKIKGILGITRNINERKKGEIEIQQKNAKLIEVNAEKDKLFSIISHDLRSPFASIVWLVELISDRSLGFSLEQIQELGASLVKTLAATNDLLENLLSWSRMQRGVLVVEKKETLLTHLVDETLLQVEEMATQKEIEIQKEVPEQITANIDERMISSVLRNLLTNAIKFTRRGGKVTINVKNIEHTVQISVTDTGVGISANKIPLLFTINKEANTPGTEGEQSSGLGLVLCKEFVEKHDGKLWAESELGKGSTFFFTLPKY